MGRSVLRLTLYDETIEMLKLDAVLEGKTCSDIIEDLVVNYINMNRESIESYMVDYWTNEDDKSSKKTIKLK